MNKCDGISNPKLEITATPKGHVLLATVRCTDNYIHIITLDPKGRIALPDHGSYRLASMYEALHPEGEKLACTEFVRSIRKNMDPRYIYKLAKSHSKVDLDSFVTNRVQKTNTRRYSSAYEEDPFTMTSFNDRFGAFVRQRVYDHLRNVLRMRRGDQLHASIHVISNATPTFSFSTLAKRSGYNLYIKLRIDPSWLRLSLVHRATVDNIFNYGIVKQTADRRIRYMGFYQVSDNYEFQMINYELDYDAGGKPQLCNKLYFGAERHNTFYRS